MKRASIKADAKRVLQLKKVISQFQSNSKISKPSGPAVVNFSKPKINVRPIVNVNVDLSKTYNFSSQTTNHQTRDNSAIDNRTLNPISQENFIRQLSTISQKWNGDRDRDLNDQQQEKIKSTFLKLMRKATIQPQQKLKPAQSNQDLNFDIAQIKGLMQSVEVQQKNPKNSNSNLNLDLNKLIVNISDKNSAQKQTNFDKHNPQPNQRSRKQATKPQKPRQSPFSDEAFTINLSPILRRAHTTFMNFDSLTPQAYANQSKAMESNCSPEGKEDAGGMETSHVTKFIKPKAPKNKGKKQKFVKQQPVERETYKPTSKWNDVISEKEIDKLAFESCTMRAKKEKEKILAVQQQLINHAASVHEGASLNFVGSSTRTPSQVQLEKCFDFSKLKVLPGYYNMGNTCFANSVLQCLVHTDIFREYCRLGKHSKGCFSQISKFKYIENQDIFPANNIKSLGVISEVLTHPEQFCAFCILQSHVQSIIEEQKKGEMRISPIGIYLLFQNIGSGAFELGIQSDAQEFLFSLLDNLVQSSFGYLKSVPFSYEKLTFVPQVFQGQLERQIICGSCKFTYRRPEDFLSLTLTMVTKNQKQDGKQFDYKKIDFFDCLADYFKQNTLDIDNLLTCQDCQKKNKSSIQYRMKNLPRILIIQMKRFDANERKLTNNIDFPFKFTFDKSYLSGELADKEVNGYPKDGYNPKTHLKPLLPFTSDTLIKRKHMYELYAMIVHQGYSSQSGHYYALIRHQSGFWLKFDDDKITLIEENDQLMQLSQKAYICFYQKKWVFEDKQDNLVAAFSGQPTRKSTRVFERKDKVEQKSELSESMLEDLENFDRRQQIKKPSTTSKKTNNTKGLNKKSKTQGKKTTPQKSKQLLGKRTLNLRNQSARKSRNSNVKGKNAIATSAKRRKV